jgi:hypothetical protein
MIASERLAILVTPAQKKTMIQRAAAADLTLSEYVRQAALGELPPEMYPHPASAAARVGRRSNSDGFDDIKQLFHARLIEG